MISSSSMTADGFSIFAMIAARPAHELARLGDVVGALHEGERDPVDAER